MESYYELADGRMFRITNYNRADSAVLLVLHGSTPRR